MFIGHYAVAFAAKRKAPQTSLGVLFAAAVGLDLLWPTLLLFGLEHAEIAPGNTQVTPLAFTDYPFSHSLVFAVLWSMLAALAYSLITKKSDAAKWVGLLVLSHWVLDLVMHTADLPLWPGGPLLGLGLWNSRAGSIALEVPLFIFCFFYYKRFTQARAPVGRFGLWFLGLGLLALHMMNMFGPPPPSIDAVAVAGHFQWLIVLMGYWVDKNRMPIAKKMSQGTIIPAT